MYYYSNNYSKYIENLKLEKSKIAFQKLVEDSKEDKNPDIRIKEVPLSKESDSVTKELDIPTKDGKSFSYEGVSSEKSGNKIGTESIRTSEKSESRINPENEISNKSSEQIKDVSSFSNIEPNEVEYDTNYSSKNGSEVNGENELSSKGGSDISVESELNDKSGNEIGVEREAVSKSELDMFTENLPSSKNGADLEKQNELSSKNGKDLSGENVPSSKNGKDLDRQIELSTKNGHDLSVEDISSSKSVTDIIKNIKEEKKKEGKFADVVDNQKKKNNFILEKSYQYFLMDPKDWEAIEYEKNAKKYKYYPADSYSQINAVQKGAIEDITSVFGNSNNWSGVGTTIVSTLKIASDLVDAIWPSVNIYNEGKTANKLRWDLRLQKESIPDKREKKFQEQLGENKKEKNDFSATVSVPTKGQHPGNYEQTGDTQYHKDIDTENVAEIESSKDDSVLVHDGPANESGDLDTNFFEDSDLTNKDSDETRKDITNSESGGYANDESKRNSGVNNKVFNFSYKNKKNINNIAVESESIGEETRWYDTDKNLKAIGRIYVTPPDYELNKNANAENSGESDVNGNKAFSIPLQNNLTFEQISRAATWNAIQFFGRIGDVQQYSKTGNLEAINITTKYFVESEDGNDAFTMAKLQDIEMMYRSLVLPASDSAKYLYQEDTDSNSYYYFTRPPLLNIVLGNPDSQTNEIGTNYGRSEMISNGKNPYFNLFTDIYTVPKTNIDEKGENNFENSIYYKNFVATNVTIDKNLNDYNYYVRDKKYFDTTGFTVTLTLLEIDENYLGSLPSFNNYNYTLRSRGAI